MAVGLDDIEDVETPDETIVRLEREKNRSLSDREKEIVYSEFYSGKRNKKTQTDVPNTSGNNNASNLTTPATTTAPTTTPTTTPSTAPSTTPTTTPSTAPSTTPTTTCKLKIKGYTWGPKSSSIYGVNVVVDVIVEEQTKPLSEADFDAGTSTKTEALEFDNQGYITYKGVKYSSLEVCDGNESVAQLIKKDKDSNEGLQKLYRGWNLDLLLKEPPVVETKPTASIQSQLVVQKTTTYEKVEIQPIEIQGLKLTDRVNARLRSVKMPPIIIESVTIPADATGSVLVDSIELYGPPIIIPEKKLSGTGKTETLEDVKLPVITVYVEEIKLKRSDIPIKIRSITFPEATIESLVVPEQLSPDPEIESFTVADAPFTVSAVRAVEKQEDAPAGFIKKETIVLEDVEIKVDLNDLLKKLQFFQDTDKRPLVDLNLSNRDSTLKVRRILIPEKAEEKHTILTVSTEPIKFGQLEYSTNPNEQKEVLIPDKNPEIKLKDVVIDTKKLVEENPKKYDIPEIFRQNLPEITLSEVTLNINASSILLPVSSSNAPIAINDVSFPNNMISSQEVVTVPEKKKTVEEQKKEGKADTTQNEGKKEIKVKEKPVKKGEKIKGGKVEKVEDISKVKTPPATDTLAAITKGREIPNVPGVERPDNLPAHAKVITEGRQYKRWSQVPNGMGVFAQWEWTWPLSSVWKGPAEQLIKDNSSPSKSDSTWWEYFWNPTKGIPTYGAKDTSHSTATSFLISIAKDPQFGPHLPALPMPKYFQGISTSGTGHYDYTDASGKQDWGKKFKDFIDWNPDSKRYKKFKGLIPAKYHIWQEPDGTYSARWLTTEEFNKGFGMFPFFMQGRGFHEGFTPLGFNADWNRLVSTFRQSESFGQGDIAGYGPPLPYDYKFSLIDIGLIMNFMQCGYVNRYKLPNKARPPLAASRTEQHLMMVDSIAPQWLEGKIGIDPMAGNFLAGHGPDINLNWANEPHWCGISTAFFNRKGNVKLGGGPTLVTAYESDVLWNSDSNLTGKPLPLNRPRLEEGENDPWDESRWYALSKDPVTKAAHPAYVVRNKWYQVRDKFGAEKCQHPYDDDYINSNKGRINQIWFIPGVHYQLSGGGKPTKLTNLGADLIKTAILKLDWGGAIITHSGHVETVLALDVDGTVYRYGGNTSVGGKGGNSGNAMGIWGTGVGDFPDAEAGDTRGGFCVITRSFPEYAANRSGLGISAPWKITPVVQTYFDFLDKNPNPSEFIVYKDYGVIINKMNTILNSSFLK